MSTQRAIAAVAILAFLGVAAVIVLGNGSSESKPAASEPLPAHRAEDGKPAPAVPAHKAAADPAPRKAVEKAIWGPTELPDGSPAMPTYRRLGVDVFQVELRWGEIAPQRPVNPTDPEDPAYHWPTEIDQAVSEASADGIDVALMLTTAPRWANGDRAAIRAPENASDSANFAIAAARHYPQVHRWMIWGEPNRSDRFLPNRPDSPVGPRRYAELLNAGYQALKSVSSANIVIGGMVFTGGDVKPPDFIRWMKLPSGRPPPLDWFGANPYPFRFPKLAENPIPGGWHDLSDVDTLGEEVDAAYRPLGIRPPLWLSEFTVQSDQDSRYFAYHVSEVEQAQWLRAGYATADEAGDVKGLGWFTLLDQPAGPESANWGLMTAGGAPKPAFRAYATVHGG